MVPTALYINLVTDIRFNIPCFFIVITNPDLCVFDYYVLGYGNDHESVFIEVLEKSQHLLYVSEIVLPAARVGPALCRADYFAFLTVPPLRTIILTAWME